MTEIAAILEFDTGGDPMTGRRWCRMTLVKIAACLAERLQIKISASTVRRLLTALDYSLKTARKCLSSGSGVDRDRQFGIIRDLREQFTAAGDPVISVDTKKKELTGRFKNPGRIWCRKALEVSDHDFRSEAIGIASPYGIYDVGRNVGALVVGASADTPEFAVNAIDTWWQNYGRHDYPHARRLLVLADSGGSNGAQPRAFKKFLQERIADVHGLTVTVSHYPAGASKWNPVEHRMFSEISKTWAGHPLDSFEAVCQYARNTTTTSGLRVSADIDERQYTKGIKVSEKDFKTLNITRHADLGKWNYTIAPTVEPDTFMTAVGQAARRSAKRVPAAVKM
ncbi:MAG: ISAzo13 family transposase [Kiritimatiellae bacterium]|nr:ISAzo13 family transposase [Kiritimatiellia bacterium]